MAAAYDDGPTADPGHRHLYDRSGCRPLPRDDDNPYVWFEKIRDLRVWK